MLKLQREIFDTFIDFTVQLWSTECVTVFVFDILDTLYIAVTLRVVRMVCTNSKEKTLHSVLKYKQCGNQTEHKYVKYKIIYERIIIIK